MLKKDAVEVLRTKTMENAFEAQIAYFVEAWKPSSPVLSNIVEFIFICMNAIIVQLEVFKDAHVAAANQINQIKL